MKRISIGLLLFSLFSVIIKAEISDYGLYFKSHNEIKDKRTSLCLTPEKPFKLKNYFAIEFNVNFRSENVLFGTVFRMIIDKKQHLDIVLLGNPLLPELLFTDGDKIAYSVPVGQRNTAFNRWGRVKLVIDQSRQIICFEQNSHKKDFAFKIDKNAKMELFFGAINQEKFNNHDVPPMSVKDVSIFLQPNKKSYYWRFNRHLENGALDILTGRLATTKNAEWLIDRRTTWQKVNTFVFNSKVYPVFDNLNTVYFVGSNQISRYQIEQRSIRTTSFQPAIKIDFIANQFLYEPRTKSIQYYDFENKYTSLFDTLKREWSVPIIRKKRTGYWHHNSFISPIDSTLYQLFGYGHYTYKSTIYSYSKSGVWDTAQINDKISPRYLSAIAMNNNHLYVFGGLGNTSGKQERGVDIYNDLYKIDLATMSIKKIWEKEIEGEGTVAARNLIFNRQKSNFYALCYSPNTYKTKLQLKKFAIESYDCKLLADTIPFNFQDIESYADLYYCERTNQLIAITIAKTTNDNYEANIYALGYEPLDYIDVLQQKQFSMLKWWWVIVVFFILVGGGFYLFRKRKKIEKMENSHVTEADSVTPIDEIKIKPREKKEGIYFLGGFQVINKEGVDITGEVTPVMKLLLISIILFTVKSGKGISNSKIKDLIWPDRTDESARNNRSVNLSKLRILLNSLSGIEISNENSYWSIHLSEDAKASCDYLEVIELLNELRENREIGHDKVLKLLETLYAGELLPNVQIDWVDNFKSQFSNDVIDALFQLRTRAAFVNDFRIQIAIADTILLFDTLNEEAIKLKCISLVKLGRISIAKTAFDTFNKEYRNLMGEVLSSSFETFIKE